MEKKTVKAVTRKQKYLAAIAGDGVAPSPITSDEKLMYNIAEKMNNGGGSGGGVFVVHDVDGTLDKTWQEITNAIINETPAYLLKIMTDDEGVLDNARMIMMSVFTDIFKGTKYYFASAGIEGSADYLEYSATSPDGHPTLPPEGSGD